MVLRVTILLVMLSLPVAAFAQDGRGASVGGSVSATNLDSRTSWSFGGSFVYRFNRVAGLEVEATAIPTLKSTFPPVPILASTVLSGSSSLTWVSTVSGLVSPTIFPGPQLTNERGRAVIFTNNVRVAIPTTSERLEPYFVAGGGIASVRQTADLVFGPILLAPNLPGIALPPRPTFTQRVTSSTVDLALTLGGGLSVRATSRLWIDGDLRVFRLLGQEDRNMGRFGVGVRYRF